MRFIVRIFADGNVEFWGCMSYEDRPEEENCPSCIVRTFPNIDACLAWARRGQPSIDECVEKMISL